MFLSILMNNIKLSKYFVATTRNIFVLRNSHIIKPSQVRFTANKKQNRFCKKKFLQLIFPASSDQNEERKNNSGYNRPIMLLTFLGATGLAIYFGTNIYTNLRDRSTISWDEFKNLIDQGQVKSVIVNENNGQAFIELEESMRINGLRLIMFYPSNFENRIRDYEDKLGIISTDRIKVQRIDANESSSFNLMQTTMIFMFSAVIMLILAEMIAKGKGPIPKLTKDQINRLKPLAPHKPSEGRYVPPYGKYDPFRKEKPKSRNQRVSSSKSKTQDPSNQSKPINDEIGQPKPPFLSLDPFLSSDKIKPVKTDITFKQVVGLHASKEEVMEFVSHLKSPKKYQMLGAKLPKGALLLGPPGCGKTLLVKALSNEANVPFYSMAGSEFVEIIGGLGAQRIRKLFSAARENSPAIIFIDEIDSVGRKRSSNPQASGSEMEQTLNQLLVEMDGMDTKSGVIVFAATNRVDLLDPALLRAGRFDRHIYIDLPNILERKELFNMYLKKYKLAEEVVHANQVDHLARITPRMSGADVARLCNEAALIAARREDYMKGVKIKDFELAFEKIVAGPEKKSNPLLPQERRVSAVQEAGRTLVAWFTPLARAKPVKASILPRTYEQGSTLGGFTHLIEEDRYILTTEELAARMKIILAGRAAEQLIFNTVSDASARYLKRATDLAFKQIREWGMSPRIGHLSFEIDEFADKIGVRPYSKKTEQLIEIEVTRLVTEAFHDSMALIKQHRNILDAIIEALMEKEVLSNEDLLKILPKIHTSTE